MNKTFLAIDIGASSGRHFAGYKTNDKAGLEFEEIFRFPNGMIERNGHLCWELDRLFENIIQGMKECNKMGMIPTSVGIDTWGVDFVLLDKDDKIIGDTVAYRDSRTSGMIDKVQKIISEEELYERTGIQKQPFNTIYQLMSIKDNNPEYFERAESFLMIPDYFHFLLTGIKSNEYTNATTTGLVDAKKKDWDYKLIDMLGLPKKIFLPTAMPGTLLGPLKNEIEDEVGYNCKVVIPCTHDTGSAVAALPVSFKKSTEHPLYISSGTWSLLGTELYEPHLMEQARKLNYTNEGGYEYRFRFLKNIMGLWMIQSVKKELESDAGRKITFDEIDNDSRSAKISSIVDCNDNCFLSPKSMIEAVKNYCKEKGDQVPQTAGELACVIYRSLAKSYAQAIKELELLMGCQFSSLNILGGGSKSTLLNELTAEETGVQVFTGPSEATAIGNLLVQMINANEFSTLDEARSAVKQYLSNGGK